MKTAVVLLMFLMNTLVYSTSCLATQTLPPQKLEITFRDIENFQSIPWDIVEKSLKAIGKHDEKIQLSIKFESAKGIVADTSVVSSFSIQIKDKKSKLLKEVKKIAKQKFMDF